jgi:isoleucyl-tRNA synthetase
VRTVVRLGRNLRKQHDVRVRQPLARLTVSTRDLKAAAAVDAHIDLIAEELNVKSVEISEDEADLVELSARANFKVLGPKLGGEVKAVDSALASLDSDTLHRLQEGEVISIAGHELTLDEVILQRTPRQGVEVTSEGPLSVAVDLELSEDLILEGIAREAINRIQQLRREAELDVTDRIVLRWASSHERVEEAFARYAELIAAEVLAEEVRRTDHVETADLNGLPVHLEAEPVAH